MSARGVSAAGMPDLVELGDDDVGTSDAGAQGEDTRQLGAKLLRDADAVDHHLAFPLRDQRAGDQAAALALRRISRLG